ncbi:MAG: hypothetical protein R3B91_15825 [Planctomycetaceae bacterium]
MTSQEFFEADVIDAEQHFEFVDADFLVGINRGYGLADCPEQQVLGGVFGVDEFDDLCSIAGLFQDRGTKGIGGHGGETFAEDAVSGQQGE